MKKELSKLQIIERSIIKTYRKELWARFVRAIDDYELIKENDKICCCISGGKDSMLMAKLFQELLRHTAYPFEVKYLVMNPGYSEANIERIKQNLEILGIDAVIRSTDIFEIANNQEDNPCYLCARMRRGYLYKFAKELGCNKIATGHHFDDVIETTLMNMLNSGSYQTMLPKLKSTNHIGMELIRPMYLIHEEDVKKWATFNDLHFLNCACKFTENVALHQDKTSSQRAETKKLIKELVNYNENVAQNIFMSATNVNMNMILGYKKNGKKHSYLETYDTDEFKEGEY